MSPSILGSLALTLTLTAAATAQQDPAFGGSVPVGTAPIVSDVARAALLRASSPSPTIDGRLDDDAWKAAPVYSGFRQRDPDEGDPASERTEFRVVISASALYVAVRAFDSQPEKISALLARRDSKTPSDEVEIMIDSYRDRRTGYAFAVNAAGVKRDAFLHDDDDRDDRWDAVWDAKARIDSLGWVAEFRIPLSQLRFAGSEVETVGFNVVRQLARRNEEQHWKFAPKSASGVVSLFGDLDVQVVAPPRRFEVRPYTVARIESEPAQAGNPFRTGRSQFGTAGADLKYGLTPTLTLTATVNPDFGQVEADPAEVNLSAFETFQRERRPFFTEGSDLFSFDLGTGNRFGGSEGLFYSRRIGRSPQGRADARGGYREDVGQTSILGAAKVTGKTTSGWTIGLVGALTDLETSDVIDSLGNRFADPVEPRTGFFAGRVAKDYRDGQTVVGVFATTVQRQLPDELTFLRSSALSGGLDLTHRFRRNTYRVDVRLVGSQVSGSEEAIDRTQRSSARYYQRPDRDDGRYDPTRRSLSGYSYSASIAKQGGGNWRWSTGIERRSPGLELNDVGYLRQADRTYQWTSVSRNWFRPGAVFRSARVEASQRSYWTHDWERRETGGMLSTRFTFRNYWTGRVTVNHEVGGIAPEELRGGPAINRPNETSVWFGFGTDNRKSLRLGLNGSMGFEHGTPSGRMRLGTSLSWRPAASVDVSASPGVTLRRNSWQYLHSRTVADRSEFVLGDLRQRTVSMELRGAMTFSPTLTLQFYAEPFVSSGQYRSFSRVVAPRATRFSDQFEQFQSGRMDVQGNEVSLDIDGDAQGDIEFSQPDFTALSFLSNLVLRWEYRSGSTLFLVWQHGRSDRLNDGESGLGSRVGDLFALESENRLLFKINYWISR